MLQRILDALLAREQTKVASLAEQLGLEPGIAYTAGEQLDWLASELLGAVPPSLDWCPQTKRTEYAESLRAFLLDHPFREGNAWASPVFASYCAVTRLDAAARELLPSVSSLSGLLFEFAVALAGDDAVVLDEPQFSAIHASLMAGQWQSSTSVVSVRSTADDQQRFPADSVVAQLVLLHPDGATASLDATVLLDRPGRLQLISPLANIDVDFPGAIVVSSESTSLDIGPEVFLRATSIELAGASLQVSKDTGAGEPAGSTVELEAAESFVTSAALIGNVSVNDLSIIVPSTHKLNYPWVQYRAEPEDQSDGGGTDERARRLMNKLMSLARRHGHGGERAVFIKKLEGRQGFPSPEFKRAIAALIGHGVLRGEGDMVFITAAWDEHRYDGKGREGMPSYDDKRDIWDPVVKVVSDAVS